MADKEYVCGYSHCLHHGEKVKSSESVVVGKKHFHWDCAATKQEIDVIRRIYFEEIDDKASFPVLAKIINDLVFKYELDVDYVAFAIRYYADHKTRIKSPFTLLYLRNNDFMLDRWNKSKGR